jgi:outer membrane protease
VLILPLRLYGEEIPLSAATEAFPQFQLSLQAGLIHGMTHELVFDQGQKISEIVWEMKPIIVTGYTISAKPHKRVATHFSYWSGVNNHIGSVEDSDFKDGIKSSFSKHTATLERAYLTDLYIGYDFLQSNPVALTGILGYSLRRIKMGAKDGYVESPPGSTPKDIFGMGIVYEQIYKFPYIGISLDYVLQKRLALNLSTFYSNHVAIDTLDNHFRRGIDFYDTVRGGVYYAVGPSANFRIGRNNVLSVSSLYMRIKEVQGDSYSVNTATGEKSSTRENGAGTRFNAYTVALSWTVLM